jgi:hypothetical protein
MAEYFQDLAKTWSVDLPAEWLELAASYWPKDVEPEPNQEGASA